MRKKIKIIETNIKYINRLGSKYTAAIFAVLGGIAIFFPINQLINNIIYKIIAIVSPVLLTYIVAIFICFSKNKKEVFSKNGKKVIVEFGDIFSEKYKSENIVIAIPVNRCFDTIVDEKLVSSNTLHGKVIKKIKASSKLEEQNINSEIQKKLEKQNLNFEILTKEQKSEGNLRRYPVGTIVEYNSLGNNYYLLGLSLFDENLHPQYNEQEHILAIQKLIEYHSIYGNRRKLIMPIIGGGNTGTNKSEQIILNMIIELIKFNSNFINSDIDIIVRKSAKNEINILNYEVKNV